MSEVEACKCLKQQGYLTALLGKGTAEGSADSRSHEEAENLDFFYVFYVLAHVRPLSVLTTV